MSGGCESFKWPLDKERAAFDGAALEKLASGAARGPLEGAGVRAGAWCRWQTSPIATARQEEEGRSGARYGGMLAFAAPEKPGVYQVTLSGEGWIDLVQNGAPLDSADHSGAKNCPGLRKSVRFNVGAGAGRAADQRRAGREHQGRHSPGRVAALLAAFLRATCRPAVHRARPRARAPCA